MTNFYSSSQTKKRTIDEKVLYNLLEDNFRKDTLIAFQDSVIISQAKTINLLDTLGRFVFNRLIKVKEINTNLTSQNSILTLNNETLVSASYQLNEYINKCKSNLAAIEIENEKLRNKNKILNKATLIGVASVVLNAILIFK